jgi:hypothetical protein
MFCEFGIAHVHPSSCPDRLFGGSSLLASIESKKLPVSKKEPPNDGMSSDPSWSELFGGVSPLPAGT